MRRKYAVLKEPLKKNRLKLERMLHLFANAVWGKDLNHNSPVQLKKLLYEELNLPPVVSYKGGKQKISTDRAALEQLSETYPRAKPFCYTILALRDIDKHLSVLASTRDKDGTYSLLIQCGRHRDRSLVFFRKSLAYRY